MSELQQLMQNSIPCAREVLKDNFSNLLKVADYCESNYLEAQDKRKALEKTMAFATQSLASVAYQISNLASDILKMLDLQAAEIRQVEANVCSITQIVDMHKEKVARREIGAHAVCKRFPHYQKIIYPTHLETLEPYYRKPLNFSCLDEIGHGMKEIPEQPLTFIGGGLGYPTSPPQLASEYGAAKISKQVNNPGRTVKRDDESREGSSNPTGCLIPCDSVGRPSFHSFLREATEPCFTWGQHVVALQQDQSTQLSKTGTLSRRGTATSSGQSSGSLRRSHRVTDPVQPPVVPEGKLSSSSSSLSSLTGSMESSSLCPSTEPCPPALLSPSPLSSEADSTLPPFPEDVLPPLPITMDDAPLSYGLEQNLDFPPLPPSSDSAKPDLLRPPLLPPPPPPEELPWAPDTYLEKVVTLYPYTRQTENELSFAEGTVIYVTRRYSDGWCQGVMSEAEGLFPGNYVEPLN